MPHPLERLRTARLLYTLDRVRVCIAAMAKNSRVHAGIVDRARWQYTLCVCVCVYMWMYLFLF